MENVVLNFYYEIVKNFITGLQITTDWYIAVLNFASRYAFSSAKTMNDAAVRNAISCQTNRRT